MYRLDGRRRVLIARSTNGVSLGTHPRALRMRLAGDVDIVPGLYLSAVDATIAGVHVRRARTFKLR